MQEISQRVLGHRDGRLDPLGRRAFLAQMQLRHLRLDDLRAARVAVLLPDLAQLVCDDLEHQLLRVEDRLEALDRLERTLQAQREFTADAAHELIDEQYALARRLIEENRDKVEAMAKALLDLETIDAEQIDDIMAGKPPRPPKSTSSTPPTGKSASGGVEGAVEGVANGVEGTVEGVAGAVDGALGAVGDAAGAAGGAYAQRRGQRVPGPAVCPTGCRRR